MRALLIRVVCVTALLSCLFVLCYAYSSQISEWVTALSPGCVFRRLTGIKCPGCGGTRAFKELLHGHIIEALRYNMYWLPSFFILLQELVVRGFRISCETHPRYYRSVYVPSLKTCALITLLWVVLRNVFDC